MSDIERPATKRINELYREISAVYSGGGINPLELEILAIKRYLDELARGRNETKPTL